jgi:hypothetical protein
MTYKQQFADRQALVVDDVRGAATDLSVGLYAESEHLEAVSRDAAQRVIRILADEYGAPEAEAEAVGKAYAHAMRSASVAVRAASQELETLAGEAAEVVNTYRAARWGGKAS